MYENPDIFKNAVEYSMDAIYWLDEEANILYANQKACDNLGYSKNELLELSVYDIDPIYTKEDWNKSWQHYLNTGKAHGNTVETHHRRKNGTTFPVEVLANFIHDGQKNIQIAHVRDISKQKESEKKIQLEKVRAEESEKRFKALHDASFGGIIIHDNGLILDFNEGLSDITGFKPEELIGTDISALIAEESLKIVQNRVKTKSEQPYEAICQRKNGEKYPARIEARNMPYNDKIVRVTEIRDLTAQKKIEADIEKQQIHLSNALNMAGIGYWEYDIAKDLYTFNDYFYNVYRTTVKKVGGYQMSMSEYLELMVHPDEYDRIKEENEKAFNSKNSNFINYLEHKILFPDGEVGHIAARIALVRNKEGKIIGTIGSNQDITEKKKAQVALLKAKEEAEEREFFLKETQRSANIGSYKMNFKSGSIETSETIISIFDVDDDYEKTIDSWMRLVHPDDYNLLNNYFRNEVIAKKQAFDLEYRIVRNNDKLIRWVHGIGKLQYDENRNPIGMLGTIQDITERKLIEEERMRMNTELEKRVKERTVQLQQANEDLEAFSYSISHDLRTPVRHVDGFLKALDNSLEKKNEKTLHYISKISNASMKMSDMIEELLQFSKLGKRNLRMKDVNLNNIIQEIITLHAPDCSNRDIEWKIDELPYLQGDPNLLKFAFGNIISNAIKYTSKKQKAIIEIGQNHECLSGYRCIFIKDNGAGFNMKYKENLFGVFKRLHRAEEFEGTGIGLANVKRIIDKHGGHIDAISEIGEGATFFISLPVKDSNKLK